ncbi:MAG: hypothetical protein FMNOHCHN_03972 [Ignavibacteriaceae bacterium]|nr:hypothetical protein [Ignavibacteriaceae bacterium]
MPHLRCLDRSEYSSVINISRRWRFGKIFPIRKDDAIATTIFHRHKTHTIASSLTRGEKPCGAGMVSFFVLLTTSNTFVPENSSSS